MTNIYVPDANIFAKLFIEEADRAVAVEFFKNSIKNDIPLIAPHLFQYEVTNIACRYQLPIANIYRLLNQYRNVNLTLIEPSEAIWLLAEEIVKTGNQKTGFPSIYDSIYQAIAIKANGTFVTADKKHYLKTKDFGHICLLSDIPID